MSTLKTQWHVGTLPRAKWAAAFTLAAGFLFGSNAAMAAPPPANTIIGNQAAASYTDPSGLVKTATSNLVQTTVQQVGAFNLDGFTTTTTTVFNTKAAGPGATIYAPHTLYNTGNGADAFTITVDAAAGGFSKIEVFADADQDGFPDNTTALCSVTPATQCSLPATVAGNGGKYSFVVAYSVPSTATTPTTPYSFGTVTATVSPSSPVLSSYASTTASDRDNVNLTTLAAFSATKAIGAPPVAWSANGGTWPTATSSGPASSSASCAATIAGASAPAAGCVYTVYRLNFSNTGGAPGRFAMTDTIPAAFTYVPGSAVYSSSPGVALTDAAGGDTSDIDYQAVGNTVSFTIPALPNNVSRSVSFVVLVKNTAGVGSSSTTNTAQFYPTDATTVTSSTTVGTPTSSTNGSAYTVTASVGIVVGSATGDAVNSKDTTAGTPNATAADTNTVAAASPGGAAVYTHAVFNTGNADDTVALSVASNTFPAGTTFAFYAADGTTPLVGNSLAVAAGTTQNFVVRASIPIGITATGPFTSVVLATSQASNAVFDAVRDNLTALTAAATLIDLTNTAAGTGIGTVGNGDLGAGPSPSPTTTVSTPAGQAAGFTLYLKNNDSIANSYNLTVSQTATFPGSLPSGWTVKYIAGTGAAPTDAQCSAGTAVAQPIAVAAGAQVQVGACVTPPATQTPVTGQAVYFRVTSSANASTGVIVFDTKQDAVTVTAAMTYSATLAPNNSGQVAPGGSVVYAHTLTNTGAQSCGAYTLAAAPSTAGAAANWTVAIYLDVNGDTQLDANDTLYTGQTLTLATGGTQKLLVKVFAPGGAVVGQSDMATVTATFSANCGAPAATDSSTVIAGQIRLLKQQALNAAVAGACPAVPATPAFSYAPITAAKPGDCIVYQVVATNEGASPVTNLTINDTVPSFTTLTGATQPTTQCTSSGITGTAPAYAASGNSLSCGSATNTVAPSGSATMTFSVRINQ